MEIEYLEGDATNPDIQFGANVLCHICNDRQVMGAGIAKTIVKKFPDTTTEYFNAKFLRQGDIYTSITYPTKLVLCHMIAQSGVGPYNGIPPIRYGALAECLTRLKDRMKGAPIITIHMPRIGCGLAGGRWEKVEVVLNHVFKDTDILIKVYDYKGD